MGVWSTGWQGDEVVVFGSGLSEVIFPRACCIVVEFFSGDSGGLIGEMSNG